MTGYEVVWSGASWRDVPPPPAVPLERAVPTRRQASIKLQPGGSSELVLEALATSGTADDLRRRTGLPAQTVHKTLWRLGVAGLVAPVPGDRPRQGTRYQRAA